MLRVQVAQREAEDVLDWVLNQTSSEDLDSLGKFAWNSSDPSNTSRHDYAAMSKYDDGSKSEYKSSLHNNVLHQSEPVLHSGHN